MRQQCNFDKPSLVGSPRSFPPLAESLRWPLSTSARRQKHKRGFKSCRCAVPKMLSDCSSHCPGLNIVMIIIYDPPGAPGEPLQDSQKYRTPLGLTGTGTVLQLLAGKWPFAAQQTVRNGQEVNTCDLQLIIALTNISVSIECTALFKLTIITSRSQSMKSSRSAKDAKKVES